MDGIDDLMQGDRAAIMYSDPPWGEGNLKFWVTYNRKVTGQEVQAATLPAFLDQIFGIARRFVDLYLLIEYGVRWRDDIRSRGEGAGFVHHGIVDLLYRGGGKAEKGLLPLDLHLFARPGVKYPNGYAGPVTRTVGYKTLQAAIPPLAMAAGEGAIILDPCCGMGYTAQSAIDNGLAFRGNELNAVRLAKTIARLEKA